MLGCLAVSQGAIPKAGYEHNESNGDKRYRHPHSGTHLLEIGVCFLRPVGCFLVDALCVGNPAFDVPHFVPMLPIGSQYCCNKGCAHCGEEEEKRKFAGQFNKRFQLAQTSNQRSSRYSLENANEKGLIRKKNISVVLCHMRMLIEQPNVHANRRRACAPSVLSVWLDLALSHGVTPH